MPAGAPEEAISKLENKINETEESADQSVNDTEAHP